MRFNNTCYFYCAWKNKTKYAVEARDIKAKWHNSEEKKLSPAGFVVATYCACPCADSLAEKSLNAISKSLFRVEISIQYEFSMSLREKFNRVYALLLCSITNIASVLCQYKLISALDMKHNLKCVSKRALWEAFNGHTWATKQPKIH